MPCRTLLSASSNGTAVFYPLPHPLPLPSAGFGDFVPAQGIKAGSETSIAQCSLYLLFGIALLAMSFNLVQEEVINNVKGIARRLGILKEEELNE